VQRKGASGGVLTSAHETLTGTRVDLLTPCYWPEVRRGTERFVHDLAEGLVAGGHVPRIVTSHRGRPSTSVEDGIEIVRVPRLPDERLDRRRFEGHLTHLPFSYLALRSGGAQVANAFTVADAAVAARWSERRGHPAVLSYMGVPDHPGLVDRRRRLQLTEYAVRGCRATVALSQYAVDEFWRWLGVRARLIYPGVQLERFTVGTERSEEPTIVCSATLTEPRKRVQLLIEALQLVRRKRPGARLILDRPRDATLAGRYDLPEQGVELVQMDDAATMTELLGRAWAVALPSWGEAFGLVLIEGLATGTPVVGSAGGAFPEIVDRPEVGRLFEGDAPEPLAKALLETFELAGDPSTRAACRARAEDFSQQRTVAGYEALYAELV
jgi:glycosyltransferase involved in cell wall biosynthesis